MEIPNKVIERIGPLPRQGMTPEQVNSLKTGSMVQFNYNVHMDRGPDPNSWGKPHELVITKRGVTADCHPDGGGLPWVRFRYVLSCADDGRPNAWICGSIGVGDRGVRLVEA